MEKEVEVFKGMRYLTQGVMYDYSDKLLVSNLGNIKRVNGTWPHVYPNSDGYLQFSCGGTLMLHRAVLSTFTPNPELLPEINHIKGKKTDNRAKMLEWCTSSYNSRQAVAIGLKDGTSIVNRKEVLDIRDSCVCRHKKYSIARIAERVGISKSQAAYINEGQSWTDISWRKLEDSSFIRVGHLAGINLYCDLDEGFVFKVIVVNEEKRILRRRRILNIRVNNPIEIKDINVDVLGYIVTAEYVLVFIDRNTIQARPFDAITKLSENPIVKIEKSIFWNY